MKTDKELYQNIGSKLRFLRKIKNLTLEKVASQIGVSAQQVQKYEVGKSKIDISKIVILATLFDVNVDIFFSENLDFTFKKNFKK